MPLRRRKRAAPPGAVVVIAPDLVEWVELVAGGAPRYASAPVTASEPDEFANAVLAARAAAGSSTCSVVVALGARVTEQRTVALPALSRGDALDVLARKAAGLLEAPPQETLFSALPFARERRDEGESGADQKWYVVAMRRAFGRGLCTALWRCKLDVRRVVDATLARVCHAETLRPSDEGACIVVDVQREASVISLVSGRELWLHNAIRGSFESVPTMALSLIQEIKSCDAYWRKVSRGTPVAHVVVLGVEVERAKLFGHAIGVALPGVTTVFATHASDEQAGGDCASAARIASVAACAAQGAHALDLTVHVPATRASVAASIGGLLLLSAGAGVVSHDHLAQRRDELNSIVSELERGSRDLESLAADNARAETALQRAVLEGRRLVGAGALGVRFEQTLELVQRTVRRRGRLESISAERTEFGGSLSIVGHVDPEPLAALRCLLALQAELEASTLLEAVQLQTPHLVDDERMRGVADAPLEFQLTAQWQEGPP
jgi:hypothetical protein